MNKLLTLALLLAPVSVLAQRPTISPVYPEGFSIIAPTAQYCGFDMIDTPQPGKPLKEKVIQFANGGVLVSGSLYLQLKNANTGEIVNVSSSGPGKISVEPDGSTIVVSGGLSLWNYPPPPRSVTLAAGLPAVPYTKGRVTIIYDAAGNMTYMHVDGTAEDTCTLFAR